MLSGHPSKLTVAQDDTFISLYNIKAIQQLITERQVRLYHPRRSLVPAVRGTPLDRTTECERPLIERYQKRHRITDFIRTSRNRESVTNARASRCQSWIVTRRVLLD
jgi:hypothetical protein